MPKNSTAYLSKKLAKTYLLPYWPKLLFALFFMIIAAAMTAGIAQLMQPVLDEILVSGNKETIFPLGAAVFVTFVVRGISTYLHVIAMTKIGQSIIADIQKDLFAHFMRLDLGFFHTNPSGQLISRVINDVQVVRIAVTDALTGFGKNLLTLIFLLGVMLYQDVMLSLLALGILPFASIFVAYIGKRLRKVSKNVQSQMANLSDRLSQIFLGIRQVQAYNAEEFEITRAGKAIDNVKNLNIKSVQIGNMSTPVNEIIIGLIASGIIMFGGYQVAAGAMTAGQLVAFLAAFTMAYEPMKKLAKLNNTLQTGLGATERVFNMMNTIPKIMPPDQAEPFDKTNTHIELKNIEFYYETENEKALHSISFIADQDKVTALVGPSGGGKSTIINLIPRFYDPVSGAVSIGSKNIKTIDLSELRENIALVSQHITIFDDTIAANIAYGKPDTSIENIEAAASKAAAHNFITAFPEGYQTKVGEQGVRLSGGQRQRIAIARAILKDAPILLLDEATSALDNESEELVQKALNNLEQGRTTLVIAHRLSTVRNADKIICLDKGKIVEQGTHEQLMNNNSVYARMYKTGLKE